MTTIHNPTAVFFCTAVKWIYKILASKAYFFAVTMHVGYTVRVQNHNNKKPEAAAQNALNADDSNTKWSSCEVACGMLTHDQLVAS